MSRRTTLTTLGLVVVSLGVGFVASELVLRVALPPPIEWRYPQESYVPDPETGHRLEPHQSAFTHAAPVRTNALGLRDDDYPPQPDARTVRLLALGDSQTFGNGLPLEHTWPKQLEKVLSERDGARFEVLNAGVPSTDTWQHAILLERLVEAYHPDGVVLAFYVNDVSEWYEPSGLPSQLSPSPWKRRLALWLKRSSLLLLLRRAWTTAQESWSPSRSAVLEERILSGDPDPRVEAGWHEVERSLARMAEQCRNAGLALWVAVLPRRDQILRPDAPIAYSERIAQIAQGLSLPVIAVLEPLIQASAAGVEIAIPWDGHHTAAANAVIAKEIARWIPSP